MTDHALSMLSLEVGEPQATSWHRQSVEDLLAALTSRATDDARIVIGVDGRQGSGKTTLAAQLASATPAGHVVHTDDVAWWHGFFTWERLLIDGILRPYLAGAAVHFRPPAWIERGREGSIDVPADTRILIVEGVGAGRRELRTLMTATVWVQADRHEARRRGLERDGKSPEAIAFWDEWAAAELDFLAVEQPWAIADAIVCGTPSIVDASAGLGTGHVVRGALR